eukprot:gene12172-12310_t
MRRIDLLIVVGVCGLLALSTFVLGSDPQLEVAQQQPQQKPNDPFTAPRTKRGSRSSSGGGSGGSGKEDDYQRALGLSYLFYEGQMSGNLPRWNRLLASKPGGYKHSAHLKDGADLGVDLAGGYYDAGDYLKCPMALAWTMTNLAFSAMEFRNAYTASGQWDIAMRVIKWGTDWLVKAHVKASDNPADNAFVGQVSARPDHWYFGRPEHANNARPVYLANKDSPGADLAAEYATAFASAAALFRGIGQPEYATTLFKHAKQAYAFAKAYPKNWKTPEGVFQAYSTYWPDGYTAQYAWAAAWMCKYDETFCDEAETTFNDAMSINNMKYGLGYDWDSVMPGVAAVLVSIDLEPVAKVAKTYLEGYVLAKWQDTSSVCPKESYANVCYTPKGLAYYSDWGTLRNTGNMMFLAALMGKHGDNKEAHICWTRSQMRYVLGSSTGKSYLIGYGPDQPKRPHHRQSACAETYKAPCQRIKAGTGCCNAETFMSDEPARIKINGGLVGGPDQQDQFPDKRNDYQRSEVAMDFNAGFTGAAAGLASFAADRKTRTCGNTGTGLPSCKKVADYTQCGGEGSTCPAELNGKCIDGPWQGYCCPAGQTCQKNNQYFWICKAAVPQ